MLMFEDNARKINAILNAVFGVRPAWFADPLLAKVMMKKETAIFFQTRKGVCIRSSFT